MPTLEIDGRTVTVEAGLNLIQAADRLDIEIPHYCFHPGLSIAGNCRVCLVEVEKVPKLQIACNTRVGDGMVVHTKSAKVEEARRGVLEFLLLNHPIDCPVCDQAGECKLQDYYMDFGLYKSRSILEKKVQKRKVVDVGPHVVLDQERCILCTRCTRFLDEVTGTSELGIFERGDRSSIDLVPGSRVDNPYSGNIVDVCPVGALTSKEFRFQSRVWYLERSQSVCVRCSRGCNVDVYHRRGEVFRYRPRYNPNVNKWWMCDEGRRVDRNAASRRLTTPLVRSVQGFVEAKWDTAIADAVRRLRELASRSGNSSIVGVVSARATNEEIFLLTRLLRAGLGAERLEGAAWSPPGAEDDGLLIRADKNPNTRGLELFGCPPSDGLRRLVSEGQAGGVAGWVLVRSDLTAWLQEDATREALEKAEVVVVIDSELSETAGFADFVLAVGDHLEAEGSVVNFEGQVQRLHAAFPPLGTARPGWWVLAQLCVRVGLGAYESAEAVFADLGRQEGPFHGMTYRDLEPHGTRVPAGQS